MFMPTDLLFSADLASDSLLVDTLPNQHSIYIIPKKQKTGSEIFDSLASIGQNSWITKTLYNALIRSQIESSPSSDPTLVINPDEAFAGYEGRIIGHIYFVNKKNNEQPIQDTSLSALHKSYGQMSNLHVSTQDWRIRHQLHFREKDRLKPSILSDDERLLRSLSYIHDARIYVEPTFSLDTVDIVVITKDAISYSVELAMTNIGEYQAELTHRNIFGLGAEAQARLYYDQPFPKPWGYGASFTYQNIWRSYTNFHWDLVNTSYRQLHRYQLIKPFQSTATRVGGAIEYRSLQEYIKDVDTMNDALVPLMSDYYNYWTGWSKPISRSDNIKIIFSGRAFRQYFSKRPDVFADANYDYHQKKMILGAIQFQNFKYFNTALIRNFGIVEDIPHGQSVKLTGGYEVAEFFSRPYFASEFHYAHYHWIRGYYSAKLLAGTFLDEQKHIQQGNIALEFEYFTRLFKMGSYYFRQFAGMSTNYGINRFPEESILAKETLPGLASQYLRPFQSKTVVRAESYLFAPWHPMQFHFTFSAYVDVAAVREKYEVWNDPILLTGAGIGITVRNEFLVIQNLAIRITYYPETELYGKHFGGNANTGNPARYRPFSIREPEVIPLR